jgi:putative transposase
MAVLDWHSRRVLAYRVSITMEADFYVEALHEAAARHGAPEIVKSEHWLIWTDCGYTFI